MWKSATIGILAIWLLVAPFVLSTSESNLYNSWLVGAIVTIAAIVMSDGRLWERPLAAAAGIWLFICGFVPSMLQGRNATVNDVALAVVLIAAAVSAGRHLREDVRELDRLGVLPEARV